MTSAEVHISTSNSRNGSKMKDYGNWTGNATPHEEPEHEQQGKEKCARKKDLMQAKCLKCDQIGHHTCGGAEPKKALSNIS